MAQRWAFTLKLEPTSEPSILPLVHTNYGFLFSNLHHCDTCALSRGADGLHNLSSYPTFDDNFKAHCFCRWVQLLVIIIVTLHITLRVFGYTLNGILIIKAIPIGALEQAKGIEPSSSAWKADVLAVVRHLHLIAVSKSGANRKTQLLKF